VKFIKSILVCLAVFTANVYAEPIAFKEGTHFQVLKQPVSNKREVREFFSFYCPGCYRFEPVIGELASLLPSAVPLNKNHVDNMPGRELVIEQALTKALIIAEKLNVKEKVVPAIFNYIHANRANFDNVKDIKNIFILNGVDGDKFDQAFKNFSVNAKFKQMVSKTELLRSQGFNSVPTLVIHGKYVPNTKSIKSMEEYKALIQFLVNKEA
jgi:thiol:disulfide interchange protein DsbA